MAVFSLEINDADVQRVFDAVCGNYKWPVQVDNPDFEEGAVDGEGNPILEEIDNPESQGDFTHRIVRQFLSDNVAAWEIKEAKRLAAVDLDVSVDLGNPE